MRKKIIAIMAAVLALLVIVAVVLGMRGKDTSGKSGTDVEIEAEAGLEESIFDNEDAEGTVAADGEDANGTSGSSSESPEEVTLGDEPIGNTGNQKNISGNTTNKSNKTDKTDKSDKTNKNDKNNKNDKDSSGTTPSVKEDGKMKYEEFHAMDPSKQQAYMESFDDIDDFFEWYNEAKAQYEKENPSIEVDGGSVDLDKLLKDN